MLCGGRAQVIDEMVQGLRGEGRRGEVVPLPLPLHTVLSDLVIMQNDEVRDTPQGCAGTLLRGVASGVSWELIFRHTSDKDICQGSLLYDCRQVLPLQQQRLDKICRQRKHGLFHLHLCH